MTHDIHRSRSVCVWRDAAVHNDDEGDTTDPTLRTSSGWCNKRGAACTPPLSRFTNAPAPPHPSQTPTQVHVQCVECKGSSRGGGGVTQALCPAQRQVLLLLLGLLLHCVRTAHADAVLIQEAPSLACLVVARSATTPHPPRIARATRLSEQQSVALTVRWRCFCLVFGFQCCSR